MPTPAAPVLLDLAGLTGGERPFDYAWQLGLVERATAIIAPEDRLATLASLVNGQGVTVLTGPLGKSFWLPVSREVKVRVEPDGYEMLEREGVLTWAALRCGIPAAHVAKNTGRKKYAELWAQAEAMADALDDAVIDTVPLVYEQFPVRIVYWTDPLLHADEVLAMDYEWYRDTKLPFGYSLSGPEDNVYVYRTQFLRVDMHDRLAQRRLPTVFHQARADLGTQYPGDPLDLLVDGKSPVHDTALMAYLLGEKVLKLKVLTRKYLDRDPMEYDENLDQFPVAVQARYAAAGDTRNTYDLFRLFMRRLMETGQWEVYENIERPLVPMIASMEKFGSPLDMPAVIRAYREHVLIEVGLQRAIMDHYGRDVRDDMETRMLVKDQTGYDPGTVDQRVLARNPAGYIDLILLFRQTRTRRNNFLGAHIKRWVAAGKPVDYRCYPRFNQASNWSEDKTAPGTGRLSSSEPNFQNQPRLFRYIFVAPPGYDFWSFDYTGLELHLAAAISGDPTMLRALTTPGRDLHTEFQNSITRLTGKDVGRVPAKTANFEQLYGGRAKKLVQILAKQRAFIDLKTAETIVDAHENTFPGYHRWAREVVAQSRERGYSETLWGRRRYLPDLYSPDSEARSHAERAAVNHVIQGTAADLVKMAMVRCVPILRKYGAHLAIQAHDEVCGWLPKDADHDGFEAEMKAALVDVVLPRGLKLKVAGGIGDSWDEVH